MPPVRVAFFFVFTTICLIFLMLRWIDRVLLVVIFFSFLVLDLMRLA